MNSIGLKETKTNKVFVYGSLKKNFGNHNYFLQEQEFLGGHVTEPIYSMYSMGGFPGVELNGTTAISGEVYEVTEECMAALDRLEGYPHFYNRQRIGTPYGKVWMYYIEEHVFNINDLIPTGDWNESRGW